MTSGAPVLETDRLRLRGHRESDWDACARMWAHPDVVRYIGGKPFSRAETWAKILRLVGHWALLGNGYWIVEEKASGAFVGEVGFGDFRRDMTPSLDGAPELGWVLMPEMHGRGYATEACRAAIAWGAGRPGFARLSCIIEPGNSASLRVAEKLGFREFARAALANQPVILFERV